MGDGHDITRHDFHTIQYLAKLEILICHSYLQLCMRVTSGLSNYTSRPHMGCDCNTVSIGALSDQDKGGGKRLL